MNHDVKSLQIILANHYTLTANKTGDICNNQKKSFKKTVEYTSTNLVRGEQLGG